MLLKKKKKRWENVVHSSFTALSWLLWFLVILQNQLLFHSTGKSLLCCGVSNNSPSWILSISESSCGPAVEMCFQIIHLDCWITDRNDVQWSYFTAGVCWVPVIKQLWPLSSQEDNWSRVLMCSWDCSKSILHQCSGPYWLLLSAISIGCQWDYLATFVPPDRLEPHLHPSTQRNPLDFKSLH